MTVYFDNASTTRVRDEVIDVMTRLMRFEYGNPSSSHLMGRSAKETLEQSRRQLAAALSAAPEEVFFTSGGTEADNWAILGAAEALSHSGRHIIISQTEHDAVRRPAALLESRGWSVTALAPDKNGRITAESFAAALREDTVLASVMLVNNETGALNPIRDMTDEIRRRGLKTVFHTDAVQAFMKTPFTVKALGADLVSVSSHKIHGPKGAGALYVKNGVKLQSLLYGGKQERDRRPGTEALPAVAGFGEAVRLARQEQEANTAAVSQLYAYTITRLRESLPDAVIISPGDSPYILSFSLPGYKSEVLLNTLDAEGIYLSKSSACKKGARSHVLEAMRLKNNVIDGALRVSFSRESTMAEVDIFIEKLTEAAKRLYKTLR
jgi:cysteine desulfurase